MVRNVVFIEDAAGWVGVYIDGIIEDVAFEWGPQGIADLLNGEPCTISFDQDDSKYGSRLSDWPSRHAYPVSVKTFSERYDDVAFMRHLAEENCTEMQYAWGKLKPEWLIQVALLPGVLSDKELRLFAVHCARSVEPRFKDERTTEAINVAERFANDIATENELAEARKAARLASSERCRPPLFDAAWASCAAEARAAARAASSAAAYTAESGSDNVASQANWLRENTQPNFERTKNHK